MGQDVVRLVMRFPREMHRVVKALAAGERRSFHAQVLVLLTEALTARQQLARQETKRDR